MQRATGHLAGMQHLNPGNETAGMDELGPVPIVPGNGGASTGGMSRNVGG